VEGTSLLLIDDDRDYCGDLSLVLSRQFSLSVCHDGPQALELLQDGVPDVVLLDVDFGQDKMPGLEILEHIRALPDAPPVIMLSGSRNLDTVVKAIKLGAFHYVPKTSDLPQLLNLIEQALASQRSRLMIQAQRDEVQRLTGSFIAGDDLTFQLLHRVDQVAATDATVLITGESGTGKEMVARRIHEQSGLDGPFVGINCAAVPHEIIESEIFGHGKGAFTGADKQRTGKFELAAGGTLFLDEIGESPLAFQVKLLRVLGERVYTRLGENKDLQVRTRVLAATSKDLAKAMERGEFRSDLYYRLNNYRVHLAPLHERPGDILPLARIFLTEAAGRFRKDIHGFSPGAEKSLLSNLWPGNVRQLRNEVERAVITCSGQMVSLGSMFSPESFSSSRQLPYDQAKDRVLRDWQTSYLTNRLRETGGNVSEAAERSELPRPSFQRLIRKLGIDPEEFRD
jgi:DNA-binding NtrC family response regulator